MCCLLGRRPPRSRLGKGFDALNGSHANISVFGGLGPGYASCARSALSRELCNNNMWRLCPLDRQDRKGKEVLIASLGCHCMTERPLLYSDRMGKRLPSSLSNSLAAVCTVR